ncbi:DUF302 domain-containing protein [Mycobacterium sp.]|uniref:DUF302 domain-containing protein n=1 Tax=Mycobacterium sp. TaxID=1785 RepID=UPI0031D7C8F4
MTTDLSTKLDVEFDEAVERTTQALAEQGFGVLTTIDVAATLKKKLGKDMEKYLILGACNPGLAHKALDIDRQLGQFLPCNVVVRADPAGGVLVEAMDPQVMVQFADQADALQAVADEAAAKLHAAIEQLHHTASA